MRTISTSTTSLAQARTLLFVPGNRPERFENALKSGADAVVLDLEDSVPPSAKQSGINATNLDLALEDLDWLSRLSPPAGVMVPKAESAAALSGVAERLGSVALLPLIESAAGYAALSDIAAAPSVMRLVIGHIDFMADTGLQYSTDERELIPLRFAVAMATRLHKLAPAVDGVTDAIRDDERLRDDTRRAVHFGFGGKLCIHPRQVAVVHDALAPSAEEVEWAGRVIAADADSGGRAVQIDGRMVDAPVVLQAHRTLARARRSHAP